MNFNILKYEYKVPSNLIKTSKSGWEFVNNADDVDKIYSSISEYLDRMHNLTDEEISDLFKISTKSNARDYGTSDYKIEVTSKFRPEQRLVVTRNFSKPGYKQEKVYSDVFAPLEDTLEIIRQSFKFFVKKGKFPEELEEKNEKISKAIEKEIAGLRREIEDRFSRILNKEKYISERESEDREQFSKYQKENEYKRQIKEGILTWYATFFKDERKENPYIPYMRKENPDFYKMVIDESTGEGTIYKLKNEASMDDNGRGYRVFYAVCGDKIEKKVGKIPNATREKAKRYIMRLNKEYNFITETKPGKRVKTGFEDSSD